MVTKNNFHIPVLILLFFTSIISYAQDINMLQKKAEIKRLKGILDEQAR